MHSYFLTGVLLLFGGVLGLHRFYTGHIGSGLLYLLTGGVLGMGVLYDMFKFTSGEFEDSKGETLEGYSSNLGWGFAIVYLLVIVLGALSYFH